ncbi:MAG TPA: CpsB/CapC family capsule biosynthesis tyrosine phosphatase [Solirubrobacteraceae bacterium]|nr:CpsB/CapC family capsule biosynthesis tyrosine phosphatase [Solirubrobacteraceae bacterium]
MIDLHSHVLPGIDDGPRDEASALAMAQVAAAAGTTVLAATPHVRADHPDVVPSEIRGRVAALQALLDAEGVPLRIAPGAEIDLAEALALDDAELRSITLGANGRDLLVESPWTPLPSIFTPALDALAARGFRVLLAHPELSPTFQGRPDRLGRLVARGVLLQVTAANLISSRRGIRRTARLIVENGWGHVLASDAHSASWRPPDLAGGLEAARDALPHAAEQLEWMALEAPRAVLEGAELPARPPVEQPPGGRLGRLLGRR